jgi:phosphoglycolate phosphatase-like HAD superfamily hydrolase
MAGVTLGFLKYVLGLDTLTFRKGMTEAEHDLFKLQKSFEKKGQQIAGLGKSLTLGLTLPLTAFAAKGIKEAQDTAAAMAQVNAAIASMGPVAGRTSAQLSSMADKLEMQSLFEADQILSKVTANLLTFGNISGQAFDKAQQAALNLSARMGTDLQASALMVGKALNDPIKGMTALGRAGLQFSEAQRTAIKAMVETGNAAGAQTIILGELERQFGGAAAAAQNADPWNKLTDAFNQMAEKVGTALLPLIPPLTNAIVSVANAFTSLSPETQKWVLIAGGLAVALGPVLTGLGTIITVIAKIGPLVTALVSGWTALKAAFIAARVAALATLPALTPFLIPLGAIAVAVGAVYLAWKNWDKIVAIATRVYTAVKTWIFDKLGAIWNTVKAQVESVIAPFRKLYDAVVGNSYIPDLVMGIAVEMAKLDAVMVKPAQAATQKAGEAFKALQERVRGLLDRLYPEVGEQSQFLKDLADLKAYADQAKWSTDQLSDAIARLGGVQAQAEPSFLADMAPPERMEIDFEALDRIAGGDMDAVVEKARDWRDILSQIGTDILAKIGDDLSAIVTGSMKLKDLWRSLLGFAIQMLTSPNGPLGSLISGKRALGGPVMAGNAYLVGERGPEIFTPQRSGRIISNDNSRRMMGSGGGWHGDMHVHGVADANSFNRSEGQIVRQLNRRLSRR